MSESLARVTPLEPAPMMRDLILAFSTMRRQNARAIGAISSSHGINPTDLRALSFVSLAGGATAKASAEHLGITTGSLTTLADRLEKVGLVRRTANPSDRRSVVLHATPQGAAVMVEVNALYQHAFELAFDDDEIPRMREAFLDLAGALGALAE